MKFRHYVLLVIGLGILVFSPIVAQSQFMFEENPLVGKQAPDFKLRTTAGIDLSLNEYRGSDPALIFFWATWCPSCRSELKFLSQQADLFAKKGIKIVLVNLEENPRQVKAFTDKLKLPFNVFLDESSQVGEQYGIIGLPSVFFVDKKGVIVKMEFGLPDNFLESFQLAASQKN